VSKLPKAGMKNASVELSKDKLINSFLKQYFNVTTVDVRTRLLHSLIPFNPKFYDISTSKPDLYGPFWIYTTLIFIIAAAGSISGYLQSNLSQNFFQEFVPVATGIVK
jgi:hypothetical protein